jgi:hypothetical protein
MATRKIDFDGTPLMPMAHGSAVVSGEKGYIHIDARFDKLAPPTQFGREYLTYVLWAITPEGRATNLGEVQRDDADARVKVTTELQAFGMILTAEPYFAVTQPSDVVVMENVLRDNTKGRAETIQAKYELLKRGSYLMNQDAGRLRIKPLEPGAPLDLAEARNAVELARLAGADRYAADTFNKAAALLNDAEIAREKRRNRNDIMQPARQAAPDGRRCAARRPAASGRGIPGRAASGGRGAGSGRECARRAEAERARLEAEQRRQAELNAQAASAQRADAERAKAEADAARAAADPNVSGRGMNVSARRRHARRPKPSASGRKRRCVMPRPRRAGRVKAGRHRSARRPSCVIACASN